MQSEITYLLLKEHKMFSNLMKEHIYQLLEQIVIKRKRKNDIVESNSGDIGMIYFILRGKVKIQHLDSTGREITKEIIREGEFFGDLIDPDPSSYDYGSVISDELVFFGMTIDRFDEIALQIPQLSINMSKQINMKLRRTESRYTSLVSDDVETRLIDFFKDWATEEGKRQGSQITLKNYLTHNDIAHLISTCRQTVTSILSKLKTTGDIRYSRSSIIISDLSQLDRGGL